MRGVADTVFYNTNFSAKNRESTLTIYTSNCEGAKHSPRNFENFPGCFFLGWEKLFLRLDAIKASFLSKKIHFSHRDKKVAGCSLCGPSTKSKPRLFISNLAKPQIVKIPCSFWVRRGNLSIIPAICFPQTIHSLAMWSEAIGSPVITPP